MTKVTCQIVDDGMVCGRQIRARGWCSTHYARWARTGDPTRVRSLKMTPERFWSRTQVNGACVDWLGPQDRKGYGRAGWDNRTYLAHRLAFFLRMGRWPGPHMRHLCNRPTCVLHAVEGTQSENEIDKVLAGTHPNASKTHCVNGHEYTAANTYVRPGGLGRDCRTCRHERRQRWEARQR